MDNEKKCACCRNSIESQFCGYCGFMNIAALDQAAEQETAEEAEKWRRELLSRLTDFSVTAYEYGWIEKESEFSLVNENVCILANASQCDGTVFWADSRFRQPPENGRKAVTMELAYRFNGREKKLKCEIVPAECDGFWRIGLEITERLQLVIFLGSEQKYEKSAKLMLNFE